MSNPARSQQRFPFRTMVRVHKNLHAKLPPIAPVVPAEVPREVAPVKPVVQETKAVVKSSTPPFDPKDFWVQLHRHIASEPASTADNHGNQRTPNKVVRIFVSSTFTDFFSEREVLIKKVFPALRDEMESLDIQIIDCDLRWGVPKDSTTEQTILTCLEEIDRCFEDNGQPFFIGLISDKFGWVPKIETLPKNITERYRWIDGASITLMEFIHGAFRTRNPNACFFIRKSEDILKNLPEKYLDKFRDKDEMSQKQVKELKAQLSQIVSKEQIHEFPCFYDGLDASSGRERVKVEGLEEFGEQVKEFLVKAIGNWYPEHFNAVKSSQNGDKHAMTFLLNKTQYFVERPNETSLLLQYVTGDHLNLKAFEGTRPKDDRHQLLLALTGRSGDGKTMLLAKFVQHLEEEMKDKVICFHYFLDAASDAYINDAMRERLSNKLNEYLEKNNLVLPTTGQRPKLTDESFLSEAISLLSIPLVIVVDGLEKGDIYQRQDYAEKFPFTRLSVLQSAHTYIVVSCETDSALHRHIGTLAHYEVELQPFNVEQRSSYLKIFFRQFNKTLEDEQKKLLLENKGGEYPLYLAYVCENLRQFGDYSLITARLKAYPQTLDELLNLLLDEAYAIADSRPMLDALFKLLIISDVGILESDIVTMLQHYLNRGSNETNQIVVSPMAWSLLRRSVKSFLDVLWSQGHQSIVLRHASLGKKLHIRFFEEETSEIQALHRFIAGFSAEHASIKQHSAPRVAYHYEQGRMYKELLAYLRSTRSLGVPMTDRRGYLNRRRCPKMLMGQDSMLDQRAYLCSNCAMQFKLGPFTVAKSTCPLCTFMITGGNSQNAGAFRREARVCQKHGSQAYPNLMQCFVCRMPEPAPKPGTTSARGPVPMNICFQCWVMGGPRTRCCGFELE